MITRFQLNSSAFVSKKSRQLKRCRSYASSLFSVSRSSRLPLPITSHRKILLSRTLMCVHLPTKVNPFILKIYRLRDFCYIFNALNIVRTFEYFAFSHQRILIVTLIVLSTYILLLQNWEAGIFTHSSFCDIL